MQPLTWLNTGDAASDFTGRWWCSHWLHWMLVKQPLTSLDADVAQPLTWQDDNGATHDLIALGWCRPCPDWVLMSQLVTWLDADDAARDLVGWWLCLPFVTRQDHVLIAVAQNPTNIFHADCIVVVYEQGHSNMTADLTLPCHFLNPELTRSPPEIDDDSRLAKTKYIVFDEILTELLPDL